MLYLASASLSPKASAADVSFRSVPAGTGHGYLTGEGRPMTGTISEVFRAACSSAGLPGEVAPARVFFTPPLRRAAVIAGNPFAYLKVTADQPGGLVSVQLVDVSPDAECGAVPSSRGSAIPLSLGSADLRFFRGNYEAQDFPVGTPTWVRIDFTHLAEVVPVGHRLALVVSWGDLADRFALPYAPHVTIDGASEIVLPMLQGTLGGTAPTHAYPPRPFLPK